MTRANALKSPGAVDSINTKLLIDRLSNENIGLVNLEFCISTERFNRKDTEVGNVSCKKKGQLTFGLVHMGVTSRHLLHLNRGLQAKAMPVLYMDSKCLTTRRAFALLCVHFDLTCNIWQAI